MGGMLSWMFTAAKLAPNRFKWDTRKDVIDWHSIYDLDLDNAAAG